MLGHQDFETRCVLVKTMLAVLSRWHPVVLIPCCSRLCDFWISGGACEMQSVARCLAWVLLAWDIGLRNFLRPVSWCFRSFRQVFSLSWWCVPFLVPPKSGFGSLPHEQRRPAPTRVIRVVLVWTARTLDERHGSLSWEHKRGPVSFAMKLVLITFRTELRWSARLSAFADPTNQMHEDSV